MAKSQLATYTEKEALLKKLQAELLALESNEDFKKDIEFKEKLEALMKKYEKSERDVTEMLNPSTEQQSASSGTRRKRKLKIYKNPETGEVVETRGGNHKQLKHWKAEFGDEKVESWLVREED
ncbi:histone-like nucleoid-structuring protein, MvaT/MvaU family [Salinicola sp. CPA57]|uniref:histone-like nucleoid-structuring protein, MvaT/MvaU family n=1 Tax=Salinicola sp. CPA57 TaxID=1949080 RepID=UPI000DA1C5CE|nr:histone-like nucleoid-structuring protein, MvaT/MvaU family [Salinicola sp. CPA57]